MTITPLEVVCRACGAMPSESCTWAVGNKTTNLIGKPYHKKRYDDVKTLIQKTLKKILDYHQYENDTTVAVRFGAEKKVRDKWRRPTYQDYQLIRRHFNIGI